MAAVAALVADAEWIACSLAAISAAALIVVGGLHAALLLEEGKP